MLAKTQDNEEVMAPYGHLAPHRWPQHGLPSGHRYAAHLRERRQPLGSCPTVRLAVPGPGGTRLSYSW